MGVVVAIVGVGLGTLAYFSASNELDASTDDFLVTRSDQVATPLREAIDGGRINANRRPLSERFIRTTAPENRLFNEIDATTQLISPEGNLALSLEDANLPIEKSDTAIAAIGEGQSIRNVEVDGEPFRMITTGLGDLGAIQIARSTAEDRQVLEGLRNRIAFGTVFGVAAAALAGWVIARRVTRPVEKLRDSTQAIALTQDLSTPIEVEGDGEVSSLAQSFNTMLAALSESRSQQRRLIEDAGHELRTPLTSVRTGIELLQREDTSSDDRSQLLQNLESESSELTTLISELVDLATDRSQIDENKILTSLNDVVAKVISRARSRSDRAITLTESARFDVMMVPAEIDRAITNLIDNAIKYSPTDSVIDVQVSPCQLESGPAVSVVVSDEGSGISDLDAPHVFERFYRADSSRSMPGSGLGLAIVRKIVESHGGTVSIRNRTNEGLQGARAELSLPV